MGQGLTDNGILHGPLLQIGTQGGQEGGLAAEAGTCGHDEEPGTDRPSGSVLGHWQAFLLQNSEIARRRISSK